MKFTMPFDFHKDQRNYPIQRDEDGQSLRQRCFGLFNQGKSAREAALILGMKLATARRYYSQWNEYPPFLQETYKYLKKELKEKGELSPRITGMISKGLGIPEWLVLRMVFRPYGLKQLLNGELIRQRKEQSYNKQEQRLEAALSLVVLQERLGIPIEWITREMKRLMQRAIKYKEKRIVARGKSADEDNSCSDDFGLIS